MATMKMPCAVGSGGGILKAIPTMTGASVPSGNATASASASGYEPYKAFSTDTKGWYVTSAGFTNEWIKYEFDTPMTAKMFQGSAVKQGTFTLSIYGSTDDFSSSNVLIASGITITTSSYYTITELNNNTPYKYYKFIVTAHTASSSSNEGMKLQLIGN